MSLLRRRLGDFVTLYDQRCNIAHLTPMEVSGINRDKEFFEPSTQIGADTSKYKNVPPGYFACNLMHVGRDRVLPIAMNHSNGTKRVSPAYTVFNFDGKGVTVPEYFFMFLKSAERDRYFWFHTDSSVRDGMSWEDFCDVEIALPPLEVQLRYVAAYKAMLENQRCYERGLDDLKLTCDAYIEHLLESAARVCIAPYIKECDKRNISQLGLENVRGISIEKKFIPTKANMDGVNLSNYKVVSPGNIAFVTVTSRNGEKITIAMNDSDEDYIVSATYVVFSTDDAKLSPEYLMLYFSRNEFDRYARFNSWGSARETFNWADMQDVEIPLPPIDVQHAIADVFLTYVERKRIAEMLKDKVLEVCPVFIKGSIEESQEY